MVAFEAHGVVEDVPATWENAGGTMTRIGQPFTCGIWTVRDGSEEEFVARWTALVNSSAALPGAESFLLIQDRQDPHRFISFGAWDAWTSVDRWRSSEAFGDAMRVCRELCEDFRPNDSTLRVAMRS
jgi:heme-degrading monooxygenase HmoA